MIFPWCFSSVQSKSKILTFPEVFSFRDEHRRQIGVTPFSVPLFVTTAKLVVRCTLYRAGLSCDQKINKYAHVKYWNMLFTLAACNSQAGTIISLRSGSSVWPTASEINYLALFHTEASTGGRANSRLTACLPVARTRFSSGSKWDTVSPVMQVKDAEERTLHLQQEGTAVILFCNIRLFIHANCDWYCIASSALHLDL